MTSSRCRGASRADVLAALALLAVGAALVPGALRAQEAQLDRANRTKCADNLRRLGLGAIQYSDDRRLFPHIGKVDELDGGYRTNATPRVVRALVFYGYHDGPEGFVCPSTDDAWAPAHEAARSDMRRWLWDGKEIGEAGASPLVVEDKDPTLAETTELSYGWTRRGLDSNARATTKLGADRMKENHGKGGNVLLADCVVQFSQAAAWDGPLASTGAAPEDGFLSVRAKDDPAPTRTVARPQPAWVGTYSDGAVTLTLAARASGWTGQLTIAGAKHRVSGPPADGPSLRGSFKAEGDTHELSATLEGTTLVLTSGRDTYRLARR